MYPDKIDYRVLIPERDDFWENADAFFWTEEEPFHSPNVQTNQQIRGLMRREGARVVVSGAAGDEVLAGYVGDYFQPYLRYLLQQRRIVSLVRELALNSEPSSYRFAAHFTANTLLPPWLIAHIKRLRPDRHQYLRDIFRIGELTDRIRPDTGFGSVMIQNMGQWKMNYWLRAGSKANFGIPIEPRVPFLDYRLVDFCFQLPPEYLIQNGWHKWILRQTVKNQLPDKVVWRKEKMGFPFPLSDWLISSRDIVFDNLSEIDCRYVSTERLRETYNFLAGKAPDHLWRLVCLALWWRRMVEGRPLIGALHGSA
jgi:asparagine synthase (glutamine-hydrolysing)